MSYHRNGHISQLYNAAGQPPSSPTPETRPVRSAADTYGHDEHDVEPGSEAYGSNTNGRPRGYSATGPIPYPIRQTIGAPYLAGPRAPPLQFSAMPSSTMLTNGPTPLHFQQAQYSSPRQGPYNPQDYATSPTHPGASYSSHSPVAPPVNQGPAPYPRYEPARYQNTTSSTTNWGYSPTYSSTAATTPISPPSLGSAHSAPFLAYSQNNNGNSLPGHFSPSSIDTPDPQSPRYSDLSQLSTRSFQRPPVPPPRDPNRVAQNNTLSRNAASDHSPSQASSLHYSTTRDGPISPSHSVFEDAIDYSNYPSSGEYGLQTPPFFPSEPSPLHGDLPQQQRGLERTGTTGRHPHSRPLPGPPPEASQRLQSSFRNSLQYNHYDAELLAQEELYEQVEQAIGASPTFPNRTAPTASLSHSSLEEPRSNGFRPFTDQFHGANYEDYSDESDAEAAAGMAAMRQAALDEAERESLRRPTNGIPVNGTNSEPHSDEDDYVTLDISSFGGGFDAHISYGGNPMDLASGRSDFSDLGHRLTSRSTRSSVGRDGDLRLGRSPSGMSATESPLRSSYGEHAYIDQSATGGFSEPGLGPRKMSFDEGDETNYVEQQASAGADISSLGNGPPNLPYPSSSGSIGHRPLPLPPLEERPSYLSPNDAWGGSVWTSTSNYAYPNPDSYQHIASTSNQFLVGTQRSTSLTSPPATPQLRLPDRSKTDAEERKRARRVSSYGDTLTSDSFQAQPAPQLGLDLPSLPVGRRFQPTKLSQREFDSCTEPWALSSIVSWLRRMAEGEADLREDALSEALLALFINKVPNIHIADAETLAAQVVKDLYAAGVLLREEEWLKFGQGTCSGVLYQVTGRGCYASRSHEHEFSGRCYASACQRTVKRMDMQRQGAQQTLDWVTFHGVKTEDIVNVPKKEVERQNILHEIVTTEQTFLDHLNLLRRLYRDGLRNANPPIISPKNLAGFLEAVFGKVDPVQKANEEFLLPQLKYRQREQGPWIVGFSDIFRDWIRKAKAAYIDYAANYPQAYHLMKQEETRNGMFIAFCTNVRNNKNSARLGWDSFLKAPTDRLQRYGLLLRTVLKNMTADAGPEISNLQIAIEEIKKVTMECDNRVAEQMRKVILLDLESKLIMRDDWRHVELNLTQKGRELLFRGDLQRTGTNKFTWLETHAILLDNYLILAKIVMHRDATGGPKSQRYDVSKMPIPMDLLVLESADDDPVIKSSVKGIATVTAVVPKASTPTIVRTTTTSTMPGKLTQTDTSVSLATVDSNSSARTMIATTNLDRDNRDERILYPFRVKHLGRELYTLYATKAEDRRNWCDKITEAKTKHASSLCRQGAEPFSLRIVADSAFAYDTWTGAQKGVLIRGTPLSRAIDDIERTYATVARPGPICRARVNCATTFVQPYGKKMMAVGTDYGVYVAEVGDARGWTRAIPALRVTQIAVLEEFNLVLLISDKVLIAHHLDVVCPATGMQASNNNSTRKAPQKLSGSKDVGFFATGRMKDRTLVFYKKKDGNMSTFRILEPILQKSTERRSRLLHRGTTDSFRDYDDFYIPTECTALDLFTTTLAVATSKGFEVLNLDKKTPFSVPDLKQPHVATIAARLQNITPLAMFRLSDVELLCVYEECAVYINKHGDVSRKFVLEFVARAKAAALEGGFLILFDTDFVEIRDTQNGRLKQVIPGRDVRCIDTGRGGGGASRTIKFALQHPDQERSQIVAELSLNQGAEV